MSLSEEQFERLHTTKVTPIEDSTSRFSFELKCSCGVGGKFYDEISAQLYEKFHLDRKRVNPY